MWCTSVAAAPAALSCVRLTLLLLLLLGLLRESAKYATSLLGTQGQSSWVCSAHCT